MSEVIILMGSKSDIEWSKKIASSCEKFGIKATLRVASAHKTPLKCLEIIKEYENKDVVFITVAGRSNALSGFVDAQTDKPVISCPPYGDKFAGADIFSSIRMPSGVAPMLVLEPENAGLAAAKILALTDSDIKKKVIEYQRKMKEKIQKDDEEING
ncbi:MAG: 5-(carboxyamino)imidazole ribonucleotide mutase [Candidatus Marinimicrobia bacterium]|nr:5-(carboxyamino)imidazole ribonucleotide mutase [Candidatus Neomarinimicrobiota bacterium]